MEELVSWMVMRFRQRFAWLLLATYLIATACGLYYIFEISAQFGVFAVEHADESHQEIGNPLRPLLASPALARTVDQSNELTLWVDQIKVKLWSILSHVADIPVPMIGLLTLMLYLQVSCLEWNSDLSIVFGNDRANEVFIFKTETFIFVERFSFCHVQNLSSLLNI